MESTIFTPAVIEKIDEFINKEVYRGVISDFDITDSHDFDRAVEDAEAGKTEFEIEIETMNSYDDEFWELMMKFVDSYIFDRECEVYTNILINLDKDSETLEVTANFKVLASYDSLRESEYRIVVGNEIMSVEDYQSKYNKRINFDEFEFVDDFDTWNDTTKSTIISLED